jgi:hypothetical protein
LIDASLTTTLKASPGGDLITAEIEPLNVGLFVMRDAFAATKAQHYELLQQENENVMQYRRILARKRFVKQAAHS